MIKTAKAILREHIENDHHRTLPKSWTAEQLAEWHAREHWRNGGVNHYHEGANRGPDSRPEGWRTGEGVRYRPE